MTDNLNVILSVTERGLDAVQRDVEALRSELQDLGIDMREVERRLTGIESASNRVGRSVKGYATETRAAARATEDSAKASERATRNAESQARATDRIADSQNSLISSRYALYDVANSLGRVGAALAGVSIYAVTVGAQFESAFTNVERTLETGLLPDEIDDIRASLVQLSGQIPLTFSEVSQIATLGNQLGLRADEVEGFTNTVARFASVTGLSIDAVSNSFGGFLAQTGLSADYLENLGSSIALVGINSNATEAQIVSLVRELAAGAAGAGFAADEIVGLAGALASFQVAPERARGVLDTYFGTLNRAVAEGGERLDLFARIANRSAEELSNLVRSGEGATVFRDLLAGIDELNPDAAQLTQILDGLGLSGLRASNTFQRFLGNLKIADDAFADARTGFIEGAELTRQYEYTLDDLSTQFTIFINGLNAVAAAISGDATASLATLISSVNEAIFAFAEFLDRNPWAVRIGSIVVAFVAVSGALLTLRALLFAGAAATFAMQTAMRNMGIQSLNTLSAVRALSGGLLGMGGAATRGAFAVRLLGAALRSIPLLGAIYLGTELLGRAFDGAGSGAVDATHAITNYKDVVDQARQSSNAGATGADALADSLGSESGGAKKSVAKAAEDAAEKVRTLVDYVSDLTGVFRRSSDLRFGSQDALDDITLAWLTLNEEVAKYQSQIRSLTADRALKEYFLGIAELYNDQVRAGELREDIAEIDDKLAEAQAGASTELEGNSRAAIENRRVFRDLLGSYEDYISALASAGASQEQIQSVISQLNSDFGAQATALGFNAGEVQRYQDRFSDLFTIINRVPRDINVSFNADPALQALNEFFAKAEEQARQAGANTTNAFNEGVGSGGGPGGGFGAGVVDEIGQAAGDIRAIGAQVAQGLGDTFSQNGEDSGGDWIDNFLEGAKNRPFNLIPIIGPYITEAIETGRGYGGGLTDGFRQVLAERDPVGEYASGIVGGGTSSSFGAAGEGSASSFGEGLVSRLDLLSPLESWLSIASTYTTAQAGVAGGDFATSFSAGSASSFGVSDPIRNYLNSTATLIANQAGSIGFQIAQSVSGNAGSGLAISNPIQSYLDSQSANAQANGSNIGTNIARGINLALAAQILSIAVSGTQIALTRPRGFSDGGYTGAGHWLQPAGVVHKGEYVIPKRHVDQATGLPSVQYVASLQRGKSAPQAGYATGGYVSGGSSGPTELGPNTLATLGRILSVRLNVGSEQLARSTSNGNSKLAWQGSN